VPDRRVRILQDSAARAALVRGIDRMTNLLRPTLGPLPRTVAIARIFRSDQAPEILDSAAIIARRTIQLADPFENMGGMLIRHLACQVFDQAGDGAATAAVLAQSLVQKAGSAIAAGANPVLVRRGVERGLAVAVSELRLQSRTVDAPQEIATLVAGMLRDQEVADMVAEVVDAVGPDGAILVENSHGTRTSHEYVDGVRWNEGFVSTFLLPPGETTTLRVLNPRILVTDHVLERAEQLVATVESCVAAGERRLMIVAPEVRDSAVGLLVANRDRGVLESAIAVRAPSIGVQRNRILEDIAVITGGRYFCQERGDQLAQVHVADLGRARQAWATRAAFGILGGEGTKPAIRQRIAEARAELRGAQAGDVFTCSKIEERIGKLAGAAAIIRVGAPSTAEQEDLKLRIEAAVRSARSALREGVVPGGGGAMLACVPALASLDAQGDERAGVAALEHAMAEPMRTILRNAGLEPAPIVEQARSHGLVYDVVRRAWVDPWASGLLDPLPVALAALQSSGSAAALALSAEVLIHCKNAPSVTSA
jgi:chaperonin GroEL